MTLLIFRLHWSKVKQAWLPPTKTVLWISVSCYLTFWFSLIPGLAMVLTAAFEFDPRSNKEATIRPTDNIEVPQVTTGINKMCLCYVLVWEQLDQKRNGLSRIKKKNPNYFTKDRLTKIIINNLSCPSCSWSVSWEILTWRRRSLPSAIPTVWRPGSWCSLTWHAWTCQRS